MKKRLVFILSRFPWPLVKGDKLRAWHQIRQLSGHFDICLCALTDEKVTQKDIDALNPFCSEIHVFRLSGFQIAINLIHYFFFTDKPVQVGYFYNSNVKKKIRNIITTFNPDHIYCQLIRTAEYVRELDFKNKTLDYMDALSAGMERRAESATWPVSRFIEIEARRLKRYENSVFSNFRNCTIISESDRNLIFQYNNEDIAVIPNGIDSEYFFPQSKKADFDLLFTGNMSYPPNVITARFLVNDIMPLVWENKPEIRQLIAGSNPAKRVRSLESGKVKVQGWVDDIRESYARSKIFIAPMIIGSGLQNKLLEAMAMGLPCITSELANKSLGAENGKSILVGSSAVGYAGLILSLLENETKRKSVAENGYKFAVSNFSWSASNEKLLKILEN